MMIVAKEVAMRVEIPPSVEFAAAVSDAILNLHLSPVILARRIHSPCSPTRRSPLPVHPVTIVPGHIYCPLHVIICTYRGGVDDDFPEQNRLPETQLELICWWFSDGPQERTT